MNTPDNCLRCGVCCFSNSPTYVRVWGYDWDRLGDVAERLAHFVGNEAYMRMRDGHCSALDVRWTDDGAPEFFCSVYERRPELCRFLERGSPECHGELETKSARVAAAVAAGEC